MKTVAVTGSGSHDTEIDFTFDLPAEISRAAAVKWQSSLMCVTLAFLSMISKDRTETKLSGCETGVVTL